MVKTTVGLTLTKFQLNAHFNLIFYFLVDNLAPLPHLAQTAKLGSWVFHHANFFPSFIFCAQPDLAHGSALAGMSDPSLLKSDQWQSHFPMHSSQKMRDRRLAEPHTH